MNRIKIGSRWIGEGYPVFIIAEAGVNHNGSLELAKKLVDIAAEARADAVKFQTFRTENMITTGAEKAKYQRESGVDGESQFDMLKKLELSAQEFRELSDYCHKKGIMFLSSPFDMEGVDLLAELDVPVFKIASGEITNFPLLRRISEKRKPIILSTGMSLLEEVSEAVELLKQSGARDIILLHCTSEYPVKFEDVNLMAMKTMKDAFGLPVGFSDHTPGIVAPIAAAALGACVVEKHFTIDKSLPGPDHKASLNPVELRQMVEGIRNVEKALGDGKKVPREGEKEIRKVARKSIVAARQMRKGERITEETLTVKRPGTGIEPKKMGLVVGKIARRNIEKDEIISLEMLE